MWKCPNCGGIEFVDVQQKEVSWVTVRYRARDEELMDGESIDSDFIEVLDSELPVCPDCGHEAYWDMLNVAPVQPKKIKGITKIEEI